jgi:hypothetical protein
MFPTRLQPEVFRNKMMAQQDKHRGGGAEVTGKIRCSTLYIVGKRCKIQEWKKDLLIRSTTKFFF